MVASPLMPGGASVEGKRCAEFIARGKEHV